ncbi:glycosyltransferase family 2 protein [Cellulomonas sp. S1-8]|uniref:glycosyltransferase family 2 protein n=1 Tax=Cellulomonas sp. S1-8 TaxID=2904790 RepID=UPI00224491D7|nr:glycosyltransferase family 2 protein [Cellulomonas sp. S1-8]UZN01942.1 glycosyltransferase family 2 protein [Cellulomonas sp. S1-8]
MSAPAPEPDVTVVTVTYDAAGLVRTCLDSLAAQRLDGVRMAVVVVDNASSDGTAEVVADEYPEVRLVRSARNLGFAGGNNLALRQVRSPYVVLVNNDAVIAPDAVWALVRAMDAAPDDVAAMAATVLLAARFRAAGPDEQDAPGAVQGPDGRWVPDPAGDVRLVNSTGNEVRTDGFGQDRGWLADAARHRPARDVFGFSGAAAVLRTSALRDVGLFDESFFMYYEDTDLSWRLRLAGYRVEHCADAVVEHVHAASSGEGSELFRFHDARNRLAMLTKDASAGLALTAVVRFAATTASLAIRRRRWDLARTRSRALGSYVRMLPGLVRERHRIGRAARLPRARVEELFVAAGEGYAYRS